MPFLNWKCTVYANAVSLPSLDNSTVFLTSRDNGLYSIFARELCTQQNINFSSDTTMHSMNYNDNMVY